MLTRVKGVSSDTISIFNTQLLGYDSMQISMQGSLLARGILSSVKG